MKVQMSAPVLDLKGKEIIEDNEPLTIGDACVNAILNADVSAETGEKEKMERYRLAQKVEGHVDAELTMEEIVQVKKWVGKIYSVMVVGFVFDHFEAETGSE